MKWLAGWMVKINVDDNLWQTEYRLSNRWCKFSLIINEFVYCNVELTHWGRETHICVGKLTIIASDNGLSPGRRQAIIWTNAGILLIGPLETNFNEILFEIYTFSFKKMHLKMSSAKWRPFCLGPNVLMGHVAQQTFAWSTLRVPFLVIKVSATRL